MKQIIKMLCISCFLYCTNASDMDSYQRIWKTHNATNIIRFAEAQVETNPCPATYFARAMIAASLQKWPEGATNYLSQAIVLLPETSTNVMVAARRQTLLFLKAAFCREATNSIQTTAPAFDSQANLFFTEMPNRFLGLDLWDNL